MQELSEAIDGCLADSEPISVVTGKMRAEGYDIFLVVDVTAGFTTVEKGAGQEESIVSAGFHDVDFTQDPRDMQFLKSLHISVG